jgi:hypothetical protein
MLKAPRQGQKRLAVCMCGTPRTTTSRLVQIDIFEFGLASSLSHAYLAGEREIQNGRTSSPVSHPELTPLPKQEAASRPLSTQRKEKTRVTACRWQKRGWEKGGGFRLCLLDREDSRQASLHVIWQISPGYLGHRIRCILNLNRHRPHCTSITPTAVVLLSPLRAFLRRQRCYTYHCERSCCRSEMRKTGSRLPRCCGAKPAADSDCSRALPPPAHFCSVGFAFRLTRIFNA